MIVRALLAPAQRHSMLKQDRVTEALPYVTMASCPESLGRIGQKSNGT